MDTLDERNKNLDKRIDDTELPTAINTLLKDAKSRRRQIKLLALTVAFDVLLTVGFGYITVRTHRLASQADSNRNAIVRSCETSNDSRKNQRQLWAYISNLTPEQPLTDEQTGRVADFNKFVDKTFALRDCQAEAAKIID